MHQTKLVLPIFHSVGHKACCQVEYGPKRAQDVGLFDGETMERLWAFLRGFANITKQMRPEKRMDLLSRALIHYAAKMMFKISTCVSKNLKLLV